MPQIWLLALIYFCLVSANPTLGFWSPTIIKGMGVHSDFTIGLLAALPYIVGVIVTDPGGPPFRPPSRTPLSLRPRDADGRRRPGA